VSAAEPLPLTVGTAGHIDHGKTALVRALTGVDTDRLPEEKRRGITIVLGYAPLRLPSGRRLSLVDVPGHERLVRVMVSGASGIDLYLLVVAADDGVMPQTLEHVRVLQALGVEHGVVAVTKADLADPAVAGSARWPRHSRGRRRVRARAPPCLHERGGEPPKSGSRTPARRRSCMSTARSRSPAPARSSPARCGPGASPAGSGCGCCPRGGSCACAACRSTTPRSRRRRPGSGWR
jgi:small GTP-binding protein